MPDILNPVYVSNSDGRQERAAAYFQVKLADFLANSNTIKLGMPQGSAVVGGFINVQTAFNSTGTDTLEIGTPDSLARYLGGTTLKTAAITPVVPTGYQHDDQNDIITLTRVPADTTATTGVVIVCIEYYALLKAQWTEE